MDRRTFNELAGLATMGAITEDVEMSAERAGSVAGSERPLWSTRFLTA